MVDKISNGVPPKSIVVYKNIGETPLECLNKVKTKRQEWANLPMTYAGRLDPMAEGLMIILIGDECKAKDKYLGLNKTYEFEILVGFSTDTYDLLGLVNRPEIEFEKSSDLLSGIRPAGQTISNSISGLIPVLKSFVSTFVQKYPSFSSKTVSGKQLFQLAKDDNLPGVLPEHEVTISRLEVLRERSVDKEELQKEISDRIAKVSGDFRQKDILAKWDQSLSSSQDKSFTLFSCVCNCSSGTYIRTLVNDLSLKVGMPMVTYSIKRTKIGDYATTDIARE